MSITEGGFVRLSEHISYLRMPTNIGLISLPGDDGASDIYLIDSGNDGISGERILGFIKENFPGGKIRAVMNTHSHADHCGGNSYLARNAGAEIWASRGEAYLMEFPEIETQLIWGGTPIHDLRSKYLLADSCHVDRVFDGEEEVSVPCGNGVGLSLRVISLPGHYVDQVGFLLTDTDGKKVMFAGDALSGRNSIRKHWIQYLIDESEAKESLRKISEIEADFYVPGHGDIVTSVEGLAELNLLAILETENMIFDELKSPMTTEELLKAVADRSGITLRTSQFCLIGSTLRSYLTGLYEEGRVSFEIVDNRMIWSAVRPLFSRPS